MACHGITNVTARLEIDLGALVDNPALALAAAQGIPPSLSPPPRGWPSCSDSRSRLAPRRASTT